MHGNARVNWLEVESISGVWDTVLRGWFERQTQACWARNEPAVVLTPSQAAGVLLKHRLAASGQPAFGVEFWTPGQLRKFLLRRWFPQAEIATQEDLRLLTVLAAKALGTDPVAQAVAEGPDDFMRALDALLAAGWDEGALEGRAWRSIGEGVRARLKRSGLITTQEADRMLAERAASEPAAIAALLLPPVAGSRWDQYFLWQAATAATTESLVLSLPPGAGCSGETWQGTWEDRWGEPQIPEADGDPRGRFADIARAAEQAVSGNAEAQGSGIVYHFGQTQAEEARAIVGQALEWLAHEDCERVCIALGEAPVLAREVTALLASSGAPHHDGFGHYPAVSEVQARVNAWIAWQKEPRLSRFCDFLRLMCEHGKISVRLARRIEKELGEAWAQTGADNLAILETWLHEDKSVYKSLEFMRKWPLLADSDRFDDYLEQVSEVLGRLGWQEAALEENALHLRQLARAADGPLERADFLGWLAEETRTPGRIRHSQGRHPFSRIHVLRANEAAGEKWTHLILGGLNKEQWPADRPERAPLPDALVEKLNADALRKGDQGEGHTVARPDRGFLPDRHEARLRMVADFYALVESADHLALTACINKPEEVRAEWLFSELLLRFYEAERGTSLTMDEASQSRRAPATPLPRPDGDAEKHPADSAGGPPDAERMRVALRSRFDPKAVFGPYEFAYEKPPVGGLELSASRWESALKRPADIWFSKVLNVYPPEDYAQAGKATLVSGNWTHGWLYAGGDELDILRNPEAWLTGLEAAARAVRRRVEQAYAAAGRTLPDWWTAQWAGALVGARQLALAVRAEAESWADARRESPLPEGARLAFGGGVSLPLTGKVDLLLERPTKDGGRGKEIWIVDYKTGSKKKLTPGDFAKGEGVQLALYVLAGAQEDCAGAAISIAKPGEPLEPQMDLQKIMETALPLSLIALMHREGILGMKGTIDDAYRFSGNFPLATIQVPPVVTEAKWTLMEKLALERHRIDTSPFRAIAEKEGTP